MNFDQLTNEELESLTLINSVLEHQAQEAYIDIVQIMGQDSEEASFLWECYEARCQANQPAAVAQGQRFMQAQIDAMDEDELDSFRSMID